MYDHFGDLVRGLLSVYDGVRCLFGDRQNPNRTNSVNENIIHYKFQDDSHRYNTDTRTSNTKILMDQEDQPSNNPNEWTTRALAVLSSANAGTVLYILFLVFHSTYPLGHALLRPLKPSSAVKTLNNTVKATMVRYQAHKGMLGDTTSFDVTRVYE